jgi:hypothetical protein
VGLSGDVDLRVHRSSIESCVAIHHQQITSPSFDLRSHPLSPVGFQSLQNMDLNAQYGGRIYVQRSKMDLSAVIDVTPLNHVNSITIIRSIEKFAAFEDILGIKEINAC